MPSLSELAIDERTARMVLSMLIEPNDPVTGRILARLGAVEALWLAERDGAVQVSAPWTRRSGAAVSAHWENDPALRIGQNQQSGVRALPGDVDWPS